MAARDEEGGSGGPTPPPGERRRRTDQSLRPRRRRRIVLKVGIAGALALLIVVGAGAWLGFRAGQIKDHLEATSRLLPQLKTQLVANNRDSADATLVALKEQTSSARQAASDPLWKAASGLPWIGPNLAAASEVAISADDIANLAAGPMVNAFDSLDWKSLNPVNGSVNLEPLKKAAPSVVSAANTVQLSYTRLAAIDGRALLPQIAAPLASAKSQLDDVRAALNSAAGAAQLIPSMMGSDGARNYLLLIQNNAELRATGGIPGALAVLQADKGKIGLTAQGSASALGMFAPPVDVDKAQETIFSDRLGTYMQDVNLTPDFPTAAASARSMWEQRFPGQKIDGVISLDPVALAMVLKVTGPIDVGAAVPAEVAAHGLPSQLTSENLVRTLLSDVYARIKEPAVQDIYFAEVAKQVFGAVSSGNVPGENLIKALAGAVTEHRILLWSARGNEQDIIGTGDISGSITGPSVPAAGFGLYLNDGTGAKMDYYLKETVQLVQRCSEGGYARYTLRVSLTNTAPADAATSLPSYVTGGGGFGVQPGNMATNLVGYGPSQARAEQARIDGQPVGLGSFTHAERPVGVVRVELQPGQSKTVEMDFAKIIQTSTPQVRVTPTVQSVSDVVLPLAKDEKCNADG